MEGRFFKKIGSALALSSFLAITGMAGENYKVIKDISSAKAENVAKKALLHCAGLGYLVSVTVVDSSGNTKTVLRMDGAGPHTLDSSRRKAYTSASAKNKTSTLLLASQSNPASQNLGQIDGFLLLGGGVPIQDSGATIGAVGVGGAPSGSIDEACAQAGIDQSFNIR